MEELNNWKVLTRALRGLELSLEVFPPLKNAVGMLIACLEGIQVARKNANEYERLTSDLATLASSLQAHLPKSKLAGVPYSISNVARAIEAQADHLKRRKQKQDMVSGFAGVEDDGEDLLMCYRRIDALFRQLQADISLGIWDLVYDQSVDMRLKDLAPVHEAFYNSSFSAKIQRRECLENTRKGVLDGLRAWRRSQDAPRIYWMNGMAGTGKTTIAYSLCKQLEEDDQLGGSFFCSRNSLECQDASQIMPTIAYQLAQYSNSYQAVLCKILANNTNLAKREINLQFRKLILEPLTKVKDALPWDVVVVIDALDECAEANETRSVLELIVRYATELPVKFFITSRPEPEIVRQFTDRPLHSKLILHLHDIEQSLVQADIQVYLAEELASIQPNEKDVERLAIQAGCLFIFAATVVRYISPKDTSKNHSKRLATMLQASSTAGKRGYSQIDELYSTILAKALEDEMLEDYEKEMRQLVLWTVVCARELLDVSTLAEIFDSEGQQEVEQALETLRSVLHVSGENGVILTFHASFPDFLLRAERAGRFWCDKSKHEEYLSSRSFTIMEERLQFNICNLECPIS